MLAAAAPLALPAAALNALRDHLRIVRTDEDALLISELQSAASLCEAFIGQPLLSRAFRDLLPVARAWQCLPRRPVQAITLVEGVPAEGSLFTLAVGAYDIDVSAGGEGRVRVARPGSAGRVRVSYEAGLAAHWTDLPEALRQGVIRLAAHGHHRRGLEAEGEAAPPLAVIALWRPWRLLRLGGAG